MKKLLFAIALLSASCAGAQSFCFTLDAQYANQSPNNNMFGLCKGDFDKDGILDLAVSNTNSGSVTIFNGLGGGNFGVSGVWPCGGGTQQIICADFNNDNFPDLATANTGGSNFSVLLNDSTGGFPYSSNVPSGSSVKSITSADFNNDGNKDIAVVNSGNGTVSAFLGNGLGNFSLSQNWVIGGTPYGICSGDFNEDGIQDLVTVNNQNGLALYHQGVGNGTFGTGVNISIPLNAPFDITAADLNADGHMDIVVADGGTNVIEMVFGTGTGSFNPGPSLGGVSGPRMVAVGDLNNDGIVDLAAPAYNGGQLYLYQGMGGGGFGPSFQMGNGGNPRTAVIGDFDADGLNDIALAHNGGNYLYIYLNTQPNPVISGATSFCDGGSTTLVASGAETYTWSTGATNDTISLSPVSTATYYVAGGSITCFIKDTLFFTVTVNPLPVVGASSNPPNICPGSQITLSGSGASTYTWSNGVVDGVSFTSPTVTTTYTVTGTDNNGCTDTSTITVSPSTPAAPNICMATVDSLSLNNVLIWDKTLYPAAAMFYIYRDTANNNYAQIAAIPPTALSEYTDTARSIGAVNGDPNITTYRYKMGYLDTCGTLSAMSPYHNTIYNYNISSLFLWNHYEIQGQATPVPGLSNYVLKRDNLGGTGTYVTAATAGASSTSINDPQYATWQTTADWRVETIWNITCTPTARQGINESMGTIVKSKSNITNNKTTGIGLIDRLFSVYPNPTSGNIGLAFNHNVTGKFTVKILSADGREIYSRYFVNAVHNESIDLSELSNGIYLLQVITESGTSTKRIIKN